MLTCYKCGKLFSVGVMCPECQEPLSNIGGPIGPPGPPGPGGPPDPEEELSTPPNDLASLWQSYYAGQIGQREMIQVLRSMG